LIEPDAVSLHLQQVVFVVIGQVRHLDGALSTALAQRLLFSAEKSQIAQLVSPENDKFDCSDGELAKSAQKLAELFNAFLSDVIRAFTFIEISNLLQTGFSVIDS